MRTPSLILVACAICMTAAAQAEMVELTNGPDVSVTYDPAVWKPLEALRPPDPGTFQAMHWTLQKPNSVQVGVTSHPEQRDEAEYKKQLLFTQKFRGDPAELVDERRRSFAGREWMVLEFHNKNTRPVRREISYFASANQGHVIVTLVAPEANLTDHNAAVEEFLGQIRLK